MKLTPVLKRLLLSTMALIYLTGLVYWRLDEGASPWRVLWLQTHSVLSLWFIGLFGYLLHSHVLVAWRRRRRIKSGLALTVPLILLMLTVPLLFYAANDRLREATAAFHTYLGLALAAPFLLHYFLATRD